MFLCFRCPSPVSLLLSAQELAGLGLPGEERFGEPRLPVGPSPSPLIPPFICVIKSILHPHTHTHACPTLSLASELQQLLQTLRPGVYIWSGLFLDLTTNTLSCTHTHSHTCTIKHTHTPWLTTTALVLDTAGRALGSRKHSIMTHSLAHSGDSLRLHP